jgi:hypothetical protein
LLNKIEDYGLKAAMFVENKIFVAAVFAFHTDKPFMDAAAIEIAVDYLLEIRSQESILTLA